MFGKKRPNIVDRHGESPAQAEQVGPFAYRMDYHTEYYDSTGGYSCGVLSVFGVEIDPKTYGVEDLEASRVDQSAAREVAVRRVLQLGETMSEEQVRALRHAADLLTLVRSVADASSQPLEASNAEVIERANAVIDQIMAGIFEPLVAEQQTRKAENEAFEERRRQEVIRAQLAKRAGFLGELESLLAETPESS